ncbi:hypothetical protein E0L36_24685 [Streptomyces sp. AJS327]|nr:hypothetical protein [Streptomyces sp. AJS327]
MLVVALIVGGSILLFSGDDDSDDNKADDKQTNAPEKSSEGQSGGDDSSPSADPSESPSEDGSDEDTEYKLAFPRTLEGGEYRRTEDLSDSVGNDMPPGTTAHLGKYVSKSSSARQLLYAGMMGDDGGSPENTKDAMLDGMETSNGMKVAVQRRDITPKGASESLRCQILVKSQGGEKLTIPVCAWANPGSGGYVAEDSAATYSIKPRSYDLEKFAERVNTIRDEVRTPK